jgi:uncharacterized protein YjbI with pentapeptide repeats
MSDPKDNEAIQAGRRTWNLYFTKRRRSHPFWRADLSHTNLRKADLQGISLFEASLRGANLTRANLSGANLSGARLTGGAKLTDAKMTGTNLTGAVMTGADMKGVKLAGGHLGRADLRSANLTRADLSEADLRSANLTRANLSGADLNGADLHGADLSGADLTDAKLTDAGLTRADLTDAKLTRADLRGADMTGVNLAFTVLVDVDVSALCSTSVRHASPLYIDARTVMRSWEHPRIKEFMLACGVPWVFADYMVECARAEAYKDLRELLQSTFISYGEPDTDFARRLYDSLIARRITVFYFPENARWGERLSNEVHTQLNSYDRVILICSEGSLNRSGVLNEIQETFDREARDGGAAYLLPIALDDYLFDPTGWERVQPDMARRVRTRVVGDFRQAQTDLGEYDKALHRLIDQLKRAKP